MSRSWCTSERAPRALLEAPVAGLIRLVHPFPSLLNATATGAIAVLAGADEPTALRLAIAMLAMQCSIGALNDIVDVPLDARQKPRKPIPAGLVPRSVAWIVVALGGVLGIALSAISGVSTAVAAVGCLGLGYLYDVRLSRTAFSWVPLALALPLLPTHAWLGSTGVLPPGIGGLTLAAILGGAGLAIANGLVDIERDASAGRRAIAVALGRSRAWALHGLLMGGAAALAVILAPAATTNGAGEGRIAAIGLVHTAGTAFGVVLVGVGAAALAARRAGIRERGWELEAIGVACLGIGWLAASAPLAAAATRLAQAGVGS